MYEWSHQLSGWFEIEENATSVRQSKNVELEQELVIQLKLLQMLDSYSSIDNEILSCHNILRLEMI